MCIVIRFSSHSVLKLLQNLKHLRELPKNESSVIIYSVTFCSKPVMSYFPWLNTKIILILKTLHVLSLVQTTQTVMQLIHEEWPCNKCTELLGEKHLLNLANRQLAVVSELLVWKGIIQRPLRTAYFFQRNLWTLQTFRFHLVVKRFFSIFFPVVNSRSHLSQLLSLFLLPSLQTSE